MMSSRCHFFGLYYMSLAKTTYQIYFMLDYVKFNVCISVVIIVKQRCKMQ